MGADYYSLASVKLHLFARGNPLGSASAFFGQRRNSLFLVSNWHVLSGRDPRSGQPRHASGAVPDTAEFQFVTTTTISSDGTRRVEKWTARLNGEVSGWFQHQKGQMVDVAMVPLPFQKDHCHSVDLEDEDQRALEHAPELAVAQNIYIVGFPRGLAHIDMLPLWKSGSIASEPEIAINEQPLFYIDSATTEGMSGSPVYFRQTGGYRTRAGHLMIGGGSPITYFVGVYAGRDLASRNEWEMQIGRVWKKELLIELLDRPEAGSFELLS